MAYIFIIAAFFLASCASAIEKAKEVLDEVAKEQEKEKKTEEPAPAPDPSPAPPKTEDSDPAKGKQRKSAD
jgi:PBP1b-binding outer membrane lipoprotein LpoB